ncbi:MAG: DUF2796 domain-containing protein [Lysobacterales bacterium]
MKSPQHKRTLVVSKLKSPMSLPAILLSLLFGTAAPAQHVHGHIELGIVVENATLSIALSAPLADLMGFEHAPKNDDQHRRLQQAVSLLNDSEAMFGLPTSAACTSDVIVIEGPTYLEQVSNTRNGETASDSGHSHDENHEHSEVHAQYQWTCEAVERLESVTALFVGKFENTEHIEIQILMPSVTRVIEANTDEEPITISLR